MLKSQPQVPVNMTLFGNKVFIYDQVKMRSLEWALMQCDGCRDKKRNCSVKTDLQGGHEKMETDIGVTQL